jgi:uncharacterized protein (TIGR01777 family)
VLILTRSAPSKPGEVQWHPTRGVVEPGRLDGVDAVVNLAGAPIADRPWTRARRRELRESRVLATEVLIESLAKRPKPPKVFVGVGHLGLFGDRGDDILDDDEPQGEGFLAELSASWERAQLSATRLGARTSVLRMSIVLSATGGVFPLMVKPFRLGFGGWLGNGKQWTSWVSIRDATGALMHLLDDPRCSGAYNGTVPQPVRNKEWCRALGRALRRPVMTHAPKWALRGAIGDLADDLFLASLRPVPRRLQQAGYRFVDPEIEPTFRWLVDELDRPDSESSRLIPEHQRR